MEETKKLENYWLELPLTEKQLIEIGDRISNLLIEVEELETAKKNRASAYKAQIDEIQVEMLRLSREYKGKVRVQEIKAFRVFDYPEDNIVTFYGAKGEQIYQRDMTPDEREIADNPKLFDDNGMELEPEQEGNEAS